MSLYLDVGNTRLKWRIQNKQGIECCGMIENKDLTSVWVKYFLRENNVEKIILSNVGKEGVGELFKDEAEAQKIRFLRVHAIKEMAGLRFAYEDVSTLGIDRCLAMIGAFKEAPVLVIDAGSAITADYVNADGEHLGGYILPGLKMLSGVLSAGTSLINVEPQLGLDAPGKATDVCVSNGLTLLIKSLINGLISQAKVFEISRYVITGGDSDLLMKICSHVNFEKKMNLVLDGMHRLDGLGWFEGI